MFVSEPRYEVFMTEPRYEVLSEPRYEVILSEPRYEVFMSDLDLRSYCLSLAMRWWLETDFPFNTV